MPNNSSQTTVTMMRCIINPDQTPNNWVPGWKGFFDVDGSEYELVVVRDTERKLYLCMLISHEPHPILTTDDGKITYFCSTTAAIITWISEILQADIVLEGENNRDF